MKKVLIVVSVISFIEWFNKENIEYLRNELNCQVHIACNLNYMNDTDENRTNAYLEKIRSEGVVVHNVDFARSPFSKENIRAWAELKKVIYSQHFDLINCHTPVASIITRLISRKARKNGSIIMYTCHGFHFHKASPLRNWILYYPVEWLCSFFCDYIVTINKEDYSLAKKLHSEHVRYIPGVGVDIERIKNTTVDKALYKKNIGIPEDGIMLLSIGELIERKNHEVIIRALSRIKCGNIYYVICGKGPLERYLNKISIDLGIANNVVLLGFRSDIAELCNVADIGAFPSKIEGLGLAGIEIMAAGVPLVSSNVHGIIDYVVDGETGFLCDPDDVDGFSNAIYLLANNDKLRNIMRKKCLEAVKPFELHHALNAMWRIYDEILL